MRKIISLLLLIASMTLGAQELFNMEKHSVLDLTKSGKTPSRIPFGRRVERNIFCLSSPNF